LFFIDLRHSNLTCSKFNIKLIVMIYADLYCKFTKLVVKSTHGCQKNHFWCLDPWQEFCQLIALKQMYFLVDCTIQNVLFLPILKNPYKLLLCTVCSHYVKNLLYTFLVLLNLLHKKVLNCTNTELVLVTGSISIIFPIFVCLEMMM
jgi:hypothetical protein